MANLSKIDAQTSYQIWILKILAIFFVFYAHMPINPIIRGNHIYLLRVYRYLGMIGVPCFLFISGFLFQKGHILKRTKSLLIPCVIWGTITYVLRYLKYPDNGFSPVALCLNIIGSDSYLYFVPVLYIIIILYNLYDNDYLYIISGVISIWLCQREIIVYSGWLTPYLNPLNFIPYFSIGHLVRKYELWHKITGLKLIIPSATVIIISLILKNTYVGLWYFNVWSVVVDIFSIVLLLCITSHLKTHHDWLVKLGKCTFVIYLSHMPVAANINMFVTTNPSLCMEILKVPVTFILVTSLVYAGNLVLTRLHVPELMGFIGYRK